MAFCKMLKQYGYDKSSKNVLWRKWWHWFHNAAFKILTMLLLAGNAHIQNPAEHMTAAASCKIPAFFEVAIYKHSRYNNTAWAQFHPPTIPTKNQKPHVQQICGQRSWRNLDLNRAIFNCVIAGQACPGVMCCARLAECPAQQTAGTRTNTMSAKC